MQINPDDLLTLATFTSDLLGPNTSSIPAPCDRRAANASKSHKSDDILRGSSGMDVHRRTCTLMSPSCERLRDKQDNN